MIIKESVEVTGRGTIFIVDLKENGYATDGYIKEIPIKIGTNIVHKGETYMVVGVETQSYGDFGFASTIGLNVRKK
jgi:hypothetical protein